MPKLKNYYVVNTVDDFFEGTILLLSESESLEDEIKELIDGNGWDPEDIIVFEEKHGKKIKSTFSLVSE
jgi:hypothetical protein